MDKTVLRAGACVVFAMALTLNGRLHAANEVMRSLEIMGGTGIVSPAGKLSKALDPSPTLWLQGKTGYRGELKTRAGFTYALLDGENSPASVHYVRGGVGLEYEGLSTQVSAWLPAPFFGVGIYFARVAATKPGKSVAYLETNESEFGGYAGLAWKARLRGRWHPEAALVWDMVFSRPYPTHLPGAYAGIAWKWK